MEDFNFVIPQLSEKILNSIETKYLDLAYANESDSQKLDIYLPENVLKPYPVIIHFHGGAFAFGTKRDDNFEPMLRGLKRGYAIISVEYRMSGEARWPALIFDAKAAVRFIRANANHYGLNADKIAVWGPSAGGYIAGMLGVTNRNPVFEDPGQGNAEYSSEVQAVVDWCGPCGGFITMDKYIKENGIGFPDHNAPDSPESRIMGSPIQNIEQLVYFASPYRYANKDIPPFLIMHGESDPVVPVQQSRFFAEELIKAAGTDKVKLLTYPGKGHHGQPWYDEECISDVVFEFLDDVFRR